MQIYMVGGAVRDALLGLKVADHDWVVVGATPEELTVQGYLPVGKDFPVFLHPKTREEYALARTERNTARGYRGFEVHAAPDVTLAQDLARRDLTINSIAARARPARADGRIDPDLGTLVDPYGGQQDLQDKVLRHVTDAFRDDPVRVLRLARFAARFADFTVAPSTLALMQDMVDDGEVDALVAERVWQELSRGLMENTPSRMFEVLRECGALKKVLSEVDQLWAVPQRAGHHPQVDAGVQLMRVLDMSAQLQASLPVRFACLMIKSGSDSNLIIQDVCERLRLPADCRELAELVAREHGNIHRSAEFGAAALVRLLERCDAFRKPKRFGDALLACECDARALLRLENSAYPQRRRLAQVLQAAQSVATEPVAQAAQAAGLVGQHIGEMIHTARVQAVQDWLGTSPPGSTGF